MLFCYYSVKVCKEMSFAVYVDSYKDIQCSRIIVWVFIIMIIYQPEDVHCIGIAYITPGL